MAEIERNEIEIARLEGKTHVDSKGPVFWLAVGLILMVPYAVIQGLIGNMVQLMTWGVIWTGWNVLWGCCLISYTRTNYTVYRDHRP
jgi:hypothetical protein